MAAMAVAATAITATAQADEAPSPRSGRTHIAVHRWTTSAAWRQGDSHGIGVRAGSLRIRRAVGTRVYRDPYGSPRPRRYELARWRSPWVRPGFGLSQLIASWDATTPGHTWVQVQARGQLPAGQRSSWDVLGRWASGDRTFHRTSLGRQRDDYSSVLVDTLTTHGGHRYAAWQLRLTLLRPVGASGTPRIDSAGAVASRLGAPTRPTSPTRIRSRLQLAVPRYSQMIHRGDYPRWDGGGEAWCSPTSTAMVLGYWHSGPTPRQYAWVDDSYPQPWVDYAARHTFDYRYDGTGNWPFNTAYAGSFGLDAFVTRLHSLREAERYLRAGIPLVASIAFGRGELDGSPIASSSGHLLVIRGFTASGNVIVNDPAAAHNRGVRRVYDRGQFENAWLPTTGGLAYVIRPAGRALP